MSDKGFEQTYSSRREKAVSEALSLLEDICQDSLEISLASAQATAEHGEISAKFARLVWLIEELRV